MSELSDIEPPVPKWRELAEIHGLFTQYNEDSGTWAAWVDWFRSVEYEDADTEELAVKALMRRLKLGEMRPE